MLFIAHLKIEDFTLKMNFLGEKIQHFWKDYKVTIKSSNKIILRKLARVEHNL